MDPDSRHPCDMPRGEYHEWGLPLRLPLILHAPSIARGMIFSHLRLTLAPTISAPSPAAEPRDRFILEPASSPRQVIIKFRRWRGTKLIFSAAANPAFAFVFTQIVQTINLRRRVILVGCGKKKRKKERKKEKVSRRRIAGAAEYIDF